MNRQKLACIGFVLSIFVLSGSARAQDGLPIGWNKAGSKPANYEISVDSAVKHGGQASACLQFTAQQAEGFATLMQQFKADAYRGKRLRMSAWVKTETAADRAQLWLRLDALKGMPGFDNMGKRPIKGVNDWRRYELVMDVPAEAVNIAFGVMSFGTGRVWVDDFAFDVVGGDVAETDTRTPEQRKQERDNSYLNNLKLPAAPANLDFEGGAQPVRVPVAVSTRVLDEVAGYYQFNMPLGMGMAVVQRAGDKLKLVGEGEPDELLALSESEFFIKGQALSVKVQRNGGQVTGLRVEAPDGNSMMSFTKLAASTAKARGEKLMAAAYEARGGLTKLKAIHNVWHDAVRSVPGQSDTYFDLYLSDQVEFYQENRDADNKTITGKTVMDGKTRWVNDGKTTTAADAAGYAASKQNMQLIWLEVSLQPLAGQTLEALALDDTTYKGKAVNVVGTLIDGRCYALFFDAATHHLMRITTSNGNALLDYSYDDYRPIRGGEADGVQLAHKAYITSGNGVTRTVTINKFKFNAGIDAAKLRKP
ncbi:MAG: hypothetical protein HYR56_04320 [Acidobacteria bacterium]|nr:hypothetical protein [Acidobacteriota bacterium]MBI3421741.1 hypothetical protein [Acidobacteriota bacterium]